MATYCPICGVINEDFATFCISCGEELSEVHKRKEGLKESLEEEESIKNSDEKEFYRSQTDKIITGLSGGLAKYFDLDVNMIRVIWIIGCVATGGTAILLYIILAMVTPLEPETTK